MCLGVAYWLAGYYSSVVVFTHFGHLSTLGGQQQKLTKQGPCRIGVTSKRDFVISSCYKRHGWGEDLASHYQVASAETTDFYTGQSCVWIQQ